MVVKKSDVMVVLGASDNPNRPSFLLNKLMQNNGVATINVRKESDLLEQLDTFEDSKLPAKKVAIFLKPNQQKKFYDSILQMNPSCIIFNPGTENKELIQLAESKKIKVMQGCTISLFMNGIL